MFQPGDQIAISPDALDAVSRTPVVHSGAVRPDAFGTVPRTPAGHFVVFLYAAIFRLLNHVRRLSEVGGASLDKVFDRYPFLGEYFAEMRGKMPGELTWGDATDWWRREIAAWEEACEEPLPLAQLERAGIDFGGRLAFMVAGLVEEDSRFGTLLAELQEPLPYRRPTLELVGQMITEVGAAGEADAWSLCRPLLDAGLLEAPNREAPRTEWPLRVPPLLWDAARGDLPERPASWCRYQPHARLPEGRDLVQPPDLLARLERLPPLLASGQARTVVLRSPPGSEAPEVMGVLARALGLGVVAVPAEARDHVDVARLLGPLATLSRSLPVISYDLGPGETAEPPALDGHDGPLGILLGLEGGIGERSSERAITLTLAAPGAKLRRRCWRRALDGRRVDDLDVVAERFLLGAGYIRRAADIAVAHAALAGRERVGFSDVRQATRSLNRQLLDTLADRLEARGSWDDLVCVASTGSKLDELERRCRHRERVLDTLGRAFDSNSNRGVRALFSGASGTGKTLAARILAAEIGMDLYRVDLAAVINKYIGETEKNLHKVLSRAEALDVVLLLDEGDSLLGQRTEVRSANDRYANLETNYLLQRLENYQGIVVVTTNLGDNVDSAFQRRMDVVVPFFRPQPEERWLILEHHLPANHAVEPELLERLALSCQLTGGQLRNVALHACLLALDEGGGPVDRYHLETAVRSEYRKAGAAFPLTDVDRRDGHGGVEAFMAAIQAS